VEHLDLTCCSLQHFPDAAVLSAPLLRTLSLAGNPDLVLTAQDVQTLEMVSFLQVLVSCAVCSVLQCVSSARPF